MLNLETFKQIKRAQIANWRNQTRAALSTRLDANETMFAARELEYIRAENTRVDMPGLMARVHVPVATDIPNGAESHTYYQYDNVGRSKFISDYSKDFPRADANKTGFTGKLKSLGSSYGYSIQDLRKSAMAGGEPLDRAKAQACREAIEMQIDEVICLGDVTTGLGGFLNRSEPTLLAAVTTFALATVAQIVAEFGRMVSQVQTDTKQTRKITKFLIPIAQFQILATRAYGPDSNFTVLNWLRTNHPGVAFEPWYRCDTAGAGATARIVGYEASTAVLQAEISQDYEEFAPQLEGMEYVIHAHARIGGVTVKKPKAIVYMDGV